MRDLPAGLGARLGQEDQEPELREHRRGSEGHGGHELPDTADAPEDEADQERPGSRSDGESRSGRREELPLTDEDAQCHPQAQCHRVDGGQPPRGVAEVRGDLLHASGRADDAHPVSLLKHQIRGAHHVDVAAAYPRDRCPETAVDVQLTDGTAGQLRVRDRDPAEVEVLAVLDE